MLNEIMKGVFDSSSKRNKSKLKSKEKLNNKNNVVMLKENSNKAIKTPSNFSKSKKNALKESFYCISELSKNPKTSTKRNSFKKNENNYSIETNRFNQNKNYKKINKSYLREENKSKNKSREKIITYKKEFNSKEKAKYKSSFINTSNSKKNKNILIFNDSAIKSNEKSSMKIRERNDNLFVNLSFNDKNFNHNFTSISLHKKSKSKKKEFPINKNNNIKKINFTEMNESRTLNSNRKSINKTRDNNNYENFNSNRIGTKAKLFSLNNNYSFFNNYSLYIIDNENNLKSQKYSNEKDYIKVINPKKEEYRIVQDLLILEQRDWYNEQILISKLISQKRDCINNYFNQIIEKYISLFEHFNWMIYSLSIYFKNILGKNEKHDLENNFINNKNIHGLYNKIDDWINGFKWKNLYIKVIPIERSKILINEIKALNYYFFDYLQILFINSSDEKNNYMKKVHLSNNILFPFIGYSKIYNYILYASVIIKPEKIYKYHLEKNSSNHITIEELIEQSNKLLNYYSFSSDNSTNSSTTFETNASINENNYFSNNNLDNYNNQNKSAYRMNSYIYNSLNLENSLNDHFYVKDLAQSKLFKEINNYNLIKIKDGKYIIFNLSKYIPNLFEIKYKNANKYNFYSDLNKEKKYFTLYQNHFLNKSLHNYSHKYIKTPEDVLDRVYNMKNTISSKLNYKEVFITNIYFKIIYEKTEILKKDYKSKSFIDYLFSYDVSNPLIESSEKSNNKMHRYDYSSQSRSSNEEQHYIKGKYVILYDLIEPIKLDYSLIKNISSKNEYDKIYDVYFLKTNYFSFFISWCDMLNKNNFNIKSYLDLKYFMKKYSINTKLLFFSLIYITNENVLDIIKIHLLIKLIYQIFIKENQNQIIESILLDNIFLYIQSILYPHELSFGNETKKSHIYYTQLVLNISILFLNYKLIDEYIGLGLLNQKNEKCKANKNNFTKQNKELIQFLKSPKEFLKHIIFIARKRPFLFLSEFEKKFNIIINPYIKFKSSISIESMEGYLKKEHFSFNKNMVFSYIKPEEISGLIFTIISNNEKEKNHKNRSIDSESAENNGEINNDKEVNNYKLIKNVTKNKTNKEYYRSKRMTNTQEDKSNLFLLDTDMDEYNHHEYYSKENISKVQLSFVNLSFKKKILSSPSKDKLKRGQSRISWKDISDKISISLPPICYKLNYNYELKQKNSNVQNKNNISSFLSYEYNINNSNILKLWNESNKSIFQKLYSCSGNSEYSLFKTYIYLFIYYYFMENDKEEAKKINSKMKSIFLNGFKIFSFNEISILELFDGLCLEKNGEELISKSLALFLLTYGEPRGRNNDSHGIIQYPLWIISKKILDLKEIIIYEYFKEMYQALDYFETKKNNKINGNNNNKKETIDIDYINNIQNNVMYLVFLNITNTYQQNIRTNILSDKSSNNKSKGKEINDNHISSSKPISFQGDSDYFINNEIFNKNYIDKIKINSYFFPSINNKILDIFETFNNKDFIIYIFKQIQNIFLSRNQLFDINYINKNIYFENLELNFQSNDIKCESSSGKDSLLLEPKLKSEKKQNNFYHHENSFIHFLNTELLDKLSYKKNIQSGVIISFGNNSHNETSHDKYEMITLPRVVFKLKDVIIEKIYSGWEHNVVITKQNEIYTFGNNQSFQCGVPNLNTFNQESIPDPTNISELYNISAKSISCGNEHTLILTDSKGVYGIGSNEDGVLGYPDSKLKSYKPLLIHFGEKDEYTKKITQISSGTVHNLALADDGKIFSWGAAMGGQLGLSEEFLIENSINKKNYYISKPSIIESLVDKDICIDKISCGEAHSVVMTDDGSVYCWGFGSNGQLGLGFCEDSFELGKGLAMSRRFLPEKIKIDKIKDIQCGKTFTMFINEKNKLLACGNNDLNQLGFKCDNKYRNFNCNDIINPIMIDFLSTFEVKKIACGEGHCLAIINDFSFERIQSLWSWGNNKFGQIGQGSTIKSGLPKPIFLLSDYCNDRSEFEDISCGGYHSLCLIKYKKSINWIYDDYEKKICKTINECDF